MTEIDIFSESFVEPQGSNVIVEGQISPTSYALIIKTSPGDCSIFVNDVSDGTNFADNLIGQTSANDPEVACGGASGEQFIDGGSLEYMLPELTGSYTIKAKKDGYQTVIMKYSPQLNLFMQDGFDGIFKYPISLCLKREEDKEIEYPVLPVEPDIEYDSPVLNDNIAIGVPIDAFRVLLGTYTFTYGAKDNIAVTTSQVIVDFPVVNRNGTLKQTTGGGDTEYRWDGHIRVKNVHTDLDAIKKIEHLGEPVDFYYMNQKKKVLVQSFDYDILDNCNATYRIRVVEYYPQKIKAFPVRIDPLIADRWGFIPRTAPGADEDDPSNRQECQCNLRLVRKGDGKRIPGRQVVRDSVKWPTTINAVTLETIIGDWTGALEKTLSFGFTRYELLKRIYDYVTAYLLNSLGNNEGLLACLMHLFQRCPNLQERFFKDIVLECIHRYVWVDFYNVGRKYTNVRWPSGKYRIISFDANSNYVGGNTGSIGQGVDAIFTELATIIATLKPPYDTYKIGGVITNWAELLKVANCDDLPATIVATYNEGYGAYALIDACRRYKVLTSQAQDYSPTELSIQEVLSLLQTAGGTLVIDAVGLEIGCMDWCNKNVKEYLL